MAEYKLEVTTGNMTNAGTFDHVFATLIGTGGKSERTELDNYGVDFKTGKVRTIQSSPSQVLSLGKLLLVKLEKDPFLVLPEDEWYCSKVVVTTPEGEVVLFPCYRWISRGELVFEDDHSLLVDHRRNEMMQRKSFYQYVLIRAVQRPEYSLKGFSGEMSIGLELKIKGLLGSAEKWENIDDMKKIFWFRSTTMSEYVAEHWKEDDFYGFQFLNGVNPSMIKRCSELSQNFPVTEEMVKPFLEEGTSLQNEMKKGNIFIYDQKKMDGIPARLYDGETLHVTGGLCLFYLNPENKLMPIAIQLHQQPSEENPIFLPSDLETDWLLAKMFIKNADSMDHQAVHHLMNTHFLTEVYTVATLRCLPYGPFIIHIPENSSNINCNCKVLAIDFLSLGHAGLMELMRRSFSEVTYSSLCLPENIAARGLESIPNFYYRDDGLKLWDVISSFVGAIVENYYPSDSDVHKDTELQDWISEIFTHGFIGNKASGFPASFHTVKEVTKFITLVIFTSTAQHAAVNNGQFDYYSWPPNVSILLHKPPPTTKGQSSMTTILETLPNVGETAGLIAMARLLSEKYDDVVPFGTYPEEQFDEPAPKQMIEEFQAKLSFLTDEIAARNSQLEVPYTYLIPNQMENSVTI
uniref:Si:dkey-17e16.9 n=1 Tax=Sparus aurata TaxID=8175 RepID=A0A671WXM6_SPAAU